MPIIGEEDVASPHPHFSPPQGPPRGGLFCAREGLQGRDFRTGIPTENTEDTEDTELSE